jgi:hypothetical protein
MRLSWWIAQIMRPQKIKEKRDLENEKRKIREEVGGGKGRVRQHERVESTTRQQFADRGEY